MESLRHQSWWHRHCLFEHRELQDRDNGAATDVIEVDGVPALLPGAFDCAMSGRRGSGAELAAGARCGLLASFGDGEAHGREELGDQHPPVMLGVLFLALRGLLGDVEKPDVGDEGL